MCICSNWRETLSGYYFQDILEVCIASVYFYDLEETGMITEMLTTYALDFWSFLMIVMFKCRLKISYCDTYLNSFELKNLKLCR